MDRERDKAEAQRVAGILLQVIRRQGISIRSLEQKMGVGNSVYQKVLGGKITMTLGHLLQLADALEMPWPDLFIMLYLTPEQPADAPATEKTETKEDFDERVLDVLRRHGLLPTPSKGEE